MQCPSEYELRNNRCYLPDRPMTWKGWWSGEKNDRPGKYRRGVGRPFSKVERRRILKRSTI